MTAYAPPLMVLLTNWQNIYRVSKQVLLVTDWVIHRTNARPWSLTKDTTVVEDTVVAGRVVSLKKNRFNWFFWFAFVNIKAYACKWHFYSCDSKKTPPVISWSAIGESGVIPVQKWCKLQ